MFILLNVSIIQRSMLPLHAWGSGRQQNSIEIHTFVRQCSGYIHKVIGQDKFCRVSSKAKTGGDKGMKIKRWLIRGCKNNKNGIKLGHVTNALMRSHYLWPRKSQNCTIPVNLEAIQITMIATKLFQPLYLGFNHVLQYNIYGLQLSNFSISLAFTPNWHPQTYPIIFKYNLKKLNYLQSPQSSARTASYGLGLQLQHVPSILSVPLDGLKLNCTGSVSFDSVFLRYCGLFQSSFHFWHQFWLDCSIQACLFLDWTS